MKRMHARYAARNVAKSAGDSGSSDKEEDMDANSNKVDLRKV